MHVRIIITIASYKSVTLSSEVYTERFTKDGFAFEGQNNQSESKIWPCQTRINFRYCKRRTFPLRLQ